MAAGVTNTGLHPKLLWPGVHAVWGQSYAQYGIEYTDLFDQLTSEQAYEEDYQVTGYGLAPIKTEGGAVTYDSEIGGIVSRYTHIAYALGYIVTHEELVDNLYEKVSNRRAGRNAVSMAQTIENIAANVYNRAFNSSYTFGDGVELCSASHPFVVGGTGSNLLVPAADLSELALEDLTIQIMGTTDDKGLLFKVMPRSLIIARQEFYNANRILQTIQQSGTANNDINVLRSVNAFPEGVKVNHYLTAPHAWFIRTNCPNGMQMFWRERPTFTQDNDFDTMNAKAKSYMRFSVGMTDWRSVFGSNGP